MAIVTVMTADKTLELIAAAGGSGGLSVVDNLDGTLTLDGTAVVDNLDGTLTIGA